MDTTRKILAAGEVAPPFTFRGADDEEHVLLEALAQGPVLLTFFQQDCHACELSYLAWDALAEEHAGDDFQLWGVSLDSEEDAHTFWEKSGVSFPVLFGDGASVEAYQLVATPSHFLIGTDGRVVTSWDAFDRPAWNAMIEALAGLLGRQVQRLDGDDTPDFRAGCVLH